LQWFDIECAPKLPAERRVRARAASAHLEAGAIEQCASGRSGSRESFEARRRRAPSPWCRDTSRGRAHRASPVREARRSTRRQKRLGNRSRCTSWSTEAATVATSRQSAITGTKASAKKNEGKPRAPREKDRRSAAASGPASAASSLCSRCARARLPPADLQWE